MRYLLFSTMSAILRAPEPGEGGGGGGNTPPEKTYTQADLDAAAAAQRRAHERKLEEVQTKLTEQSKQIESFAETQKELQKLREANMSAEERAAADRDRVQKESERQLQTLAQERDTHRSEAEKYRSELRETKLQHTMSGILARAKITPTALDDAYATFRRECTFEFDDQTGELKTILHNGAPYTKPDEAVKAWARTKPYFVEAPAHGGGGGFMPGPGTGKKLSDLSNKEVAELAHQQSFGQARR